jgi:hypothetical protein
MSNHGVTLEDPGITEDTRGVGDIETIRLLQGYSVEARQKATNLLSKIRKQFFYKKSWRL